MGEVARWDPSQGGINLNNIEVSDGPQPLAKGIYPIRVDECSFGESQSSGKPMITFKFKTEDEENEENDNRTLFYHVVLEGFGLQRLAKAFQVFQPEDVDPECFNPEEDCDAFVGCRGRAKVAVRSYEGRKVNNVQDVLPPSADSIF